MAYFAVCLPQSYFVENYGPRKTTMFRWVRYLKDTSLSVQMQPTDFSTSLVLSLSLSLSCFSCAAAFTCVALRCLPFSGKSETYRVLMAVSMFFNGIGGPWLNSNNIWTRLIQKGSRN